MQRNKINILVDVASFFALLISAVTGFVLWFVLPNGSGRRANLIVENSFLGVTRHSLIDIHNYASLVFVILILVHLVLHWSWIKNIPKMLK